ncbi:MAG: hypothetical protein M1831_000202 [Alyxoria varia]|nr:MAG: hypothetical protein M1831_000202 [Alyxoria varia]
MVSMQPVGILAGFALAANAFMIPSTVSMPEAKVEDFKALDLPIAGGEQTKIVKLDCPKCSFPGSKTADKADKNAMVLSWNLTPDRTMLELNGRPFFGGHDAEWRWVTGYPTPQVASSVTTDQILDKYDEVTSAPREMHFNKVSRIVPAGDGTDASLYDIDFGVNDLDGEQVNGAESLSLHILVDEKGKITLSDIIKVPARGSDSPAYEDSQQTEEDMEFKIKPIDTIIPISELDRPTEPKSSEPSCEATHSAALCRFKAFKEMLDSKVRALKHKMEHPNPPPGKPRHPGHPCPKMMAKGGHHTGPMGPKAKGGIPKFTFWTFKPSPAQEAHAPSSSHDAIAELQQHNKSEDMKNPDDPHGPHMHAGHRMHPFVRIMRKVFFGFVVPVAIGVVAGVAASVLGMAVGTALAMLWFRFVRKGRRGNAGAMGLCGYHRVRFEESDGDEEEAASKDTAPDVGKTDLKVAAEEEKGRLMSDDDADSVADGDEEPLPAYTEEEPVKKSDDDDDDAAAPQ